jgi:ferric-dicitrate binding protein FerR (iron transport regulator)
MTRKELDNIIRKYQQGIATKEEQLFLESLEADAEEELRENLFLSDLHEKEVRNHLFSKVVSRTRKRIPRYYWAAAASLILLIGLSGYFYLNQNKALETLQVVNKGDVPKNFVLPDGTEITLNTSAVLTYTSDFNESVREVQLEGEGFFAVAKNVDKPFIVSTGSLSTRVLGTQFNVKEANEMIEVTLMEGAVKVYHNKDTLNLVPNTQAVFSKTTSKLIKGPVNSSLYDLWLKDEIVLNEITVSDLGVVLKSLYDYELKAENADILNKRMSLVFQKDDELEKVIERINYLGEIKLTKIKDYVIAE